MSKRILLFLIVSVLVIGAASVVEADVPPLINYQGFLVDINPGGNPVPVNGTRDLRFTIYDAAGGTNDKWGPEVHEDVVVAKGLFSVMLGAGNPTPFPVTDDVFKEPVRWLQIEVWDANAAQWDVFDPRVQLVTVPYAFRVATVDSATGGTIKGDVEIKGKLNVEVASGGAATIGNNTNSATGANAVAIGAGNLAGGNNSFAVGSGNEAAGYTSIAMGQDNIVTGVHSAALLWANNVSGDNSIAIGANDYVAGEYSGAFGTDLNLPAWYSHVIGHGAGGNDRLTNNIFNSLMIGYNSTIPTLFVGSSNGVGTTGKVGIGTTSPGYKLDVDGTVQMTGFMMPTSPGIGYVLTSDVAGFGSWQSSGSDGDWNIVGSHLESAVAGNVGIGTAAPSAKLHVENQDLGTDAAAARIGFRAVNTLQTAVTGLDVNSTTLDTKGNQIGVDANTSINATNHVQEGEATGRLAFVSGFSSGGNMIGVWGDATPNVLGNFGAGNTSRGLGGRFRVIPTTSLNLDGIGTYYIGGVMGEIGNAIDGDPGLGAVSAIIGIDNNTGGAFSYAGYFDGKGYFSGNLGIGTQAIAYKFEVAGPVMMQNTGIIPTGEVDHAGIYVFDTGFATELYALDAMNNSTLLSPHDPETGEWIFYSKNLKTGRVVRVDMERMVRKIEEITGETFMVETWEK